MWSRLDRDQRRSVAGMATVIVGLHAVGFFLLFVLVAPNRYSLGASGAFTVGVGLTAYTLGMRHAFDADHICAIDNTTRKLIGEGRRPLSVGFFFALGHSTIVFALAFAFAIGIKALAGPVRDEGSSLQEATGWIGSTVAGTFLVLIAALNLAILLGVVRVVRRMRRGECDEAGLERQLEQRGLLSRFYRRFTGAIRAPWQMYPVGLLFGLGFDTATEIALLFLAAGAAGAGLPFYAILCLPILFAAGMCLLDTLDGGFMNYAYGWALARPARKVFYNLTVTALSIVLALGVAAVLFAGLAAEKLRLGGGVWEWVSGLDLNALGFLLAGLFVLTWAVALAVWRFGRVEERWSASLQRGASLERR